MTITSKDVMSHKHILIGQTKSGDILSEERCYELLKLPIIESEERDFISKIRYGNIYEDFCVGNLDDKISKDEILKEYFKNKEGSIAFEIEKIKMLAGRKKSQLETGLNEISPEIKEIKKKLESRSVDSLEELKIKKQLKILENDVRKKEENLFFDKAQIELQTEEQIKNLTDEYNFRVLISPKFKLQLFSNTQNEVSQSLEEEITEQEHNKYMINNNPEPKKYEVPEWLKKK